MSRVSANKGKDNGLGKIGQAQELVAYRVYCFIHDFYIAQIAH
jgi:hypothetical protein